MAVPNGDPAVISTIPVTAYGGDVATICVVTELVILNQYYNVAFSRDIALYFIMPGVLGVVVYSMLLRGGAPG